jgi:NAD-dependent SIR2 family protein deacetylase
MKIDSTSSLAKFILSSECKSIGILTGAGVSVASGIPDFRSVGGLYDTLQPDLITATPAQKKMMKHDPMSVVTWDMFSQNQFPYMEVRRPFILGTQRQQWKATIAHRFFELLHNNNTIMKTDDHENNNNKLTRIYTQNIDGTLLCRYTRCYGHVPYCDPENCRSYSSFVFLFFSS